MQRHQLEDDVSLVPVFRALMQCHTVVSRVSNRHIEAMGLTSSQFDVLATLGDCEEMTCKELGERTLITKGTLTPVLDLLEAKGLLIRKKDLEDARQTLITLTPEGQRLYEEVFPRQVDFLKERIAGLPATEQDQLVALLQKLKTAFA